MKTTVICFSEKKSTSKDQWKCKQIHPSPQMDPKKPVRRVGAKPPPDRAQTAVGCLTLKNPFRYSAWHLWFNIPSVQCHHPSNLQVSCHSSIGTCHNSSLFPVSPLPDYFHYYLIVFLLSNTTTIGMNILQNNIENADFFLHFFIFEC